MQSDISVYMFHNPVTGEAYIGSTKDTEVRRKKHLSQLRNNNHPNWRFQKSFNANDSFEFVSVPLECREEALDLEQAILDEYYSNDGLLNISADARYCNVSQSEESIEKMRLALTGRKLSPEHVEKVRQANIGISRNAGRKHSDETKAKLSVLSTGRTHTVSEEAREVMRQAKLGKPLSDEHKANLSIAGMGRKDTPETTQARIDAMASKMTPVICDGKWFEGKGAAARYFGVSVTTITNRIKAGLYREA